jgi:hypothetical protein
MIWAIKPKLRSSHSPCNNAIDIGLEQQAKAA